MAPTALIRHVALSRAYVCRQCQLRRVAPRITTRSIGQGFIRKTIESEWQWKEQAKEIEAGHKQSFLSMLEERGFVKQIAGCVASFPLQIMADFLLRNRDVLDKVITNKRIGGYCGIDPTAASLHVGHMLPFMVIFWMYLYGLRAFTVVSLPVEITNSSNTCKT